jgi:hypothetical protein
MSEEIKKTLNEVTAGDVSKIFEKLKGDGLIFRCNFSQISKHLLKEFLPVNPFSVDFETLAKSYLEHIEFAKQEEKESEHELIKSFREERNNEISTVVKNESEFHKYICKTYFDIIKEPKEELLDAFVKASEDIKEIDETLADIQNKIDEIYKNNDSTEIQEKKPILYYYQEHNEKAKAEILIFIKNEIKDYSLSNCYDNSLLSGLMMRTPYSYKWNPKSYKPRYPNDLENKFGELPYPAFVDLCKKYKEDKSAFYSFLAKHISDEEIVFSTNQLVQHHHILDSRKEIIYETLNIYQHGAKIMFAVAVPTIIEGILHDLCLLVGEKENDLLKEGFQYKLDKLQSHFGWELYYEYYSFRFRLFRNKVSHGRLTKVDVDQLADLLLLDLYQVFKLVQSDKLHLNQKRFVIDELNKNLSKPDFKYLMQYLLLDKTEIPPFYGLDRQIEEVEKLIVGNDFWEFLETEMDRGGDPVKHGIYMVVKVISSRKPFDKRCTKIFKKAGIEKADKEIANHYLKYLTRDF